jgi:hypothetical protein
MHYDYDRPIHHRYVDPYEVIWLSTCRRLGLHIRRSPDVFAMTDGTGLLALSVRDELDPDDTLAQQVFHELCHWIVGGERSFFERDWGTPLEPPVEDSVEYATLRLQLALTAPHGLQGMMAPTGLYRPYWDELVDPLTPRDDSEVEAVAIQLTRDAIERSAGPPWAGPVHDALRASAAMRDQLAPFLVDYRGEIEGDPLPCLWGSNGTPAV